LIYPLDILLDSLSFSPVRNVVNEPILQRLERDELITGLYELFQALLTDIPVPEKEHPGYQEALISELLQEMHALVEMECLAEEDGETADANARKAAWTSYFLVCYPEEAEVEESLVNRLSLDVTDPEVYRSPKFTRDEWDHMLVEGCLFGQFLWDTDWRWAAPLDLAEDTTREIRGWMGLDLATVHRLPEIPRPEIVATAERYLRSLSADLFN
jgi:hypothetical protein